ncbi:uncharacterized protein SPSK_02106 [Sporothrix schenckii 1099-18]|uniref:Uncharacterized protein n=1 Tax=Sporothrix schenckii 1099-18 TaxID=1397361 RepID=A0A0F2MBM2_SPOSC|nr:uncharacterized protein SPSK_02106 [Sporothrix schenckii 1099-18]KJR87032.1 hypothetical protein SPSK_02106 [Sporothrix schenckii 1099-18]
MGRNPRRRPSVGGKRNRPAPIFWTWAFLVVGILRVLFLAPRGPAVSAIWVAQRAPRARFARGPENENFKM